MGKKGSKGEGRGGEGREGKGEAYQKHIGINLNCQKKLNNKIMIYFGI
jgi:hypothetical protein